VWQPPDRERPLSQGDLLRDVYFPNVRLPLTVVTQVGAGLGETAVIQLEARIRPALVVTQDCIIDKPQTRQIALAPIVATRPQDERELTALRAEFPPRNGVEGHYVYDLFMVLPFEDAVPGIAGHERVADLKQVAPIAPKDDLQDLRVARMRPESKRLLRIKLAAFFGRASDEDVSELAELGLPPGLPD
jgi:hypothetical protein